MKIRLRINFEVEGDEEMSPELDHSIRMATSFMAEQLEARWAEAMADVQKKHPDLKFGFGAVGEE